MNQDQLKAAVAAAAIEYLLPRLSPSDVLGVGTGSTTNLFIDLLAAHKSAFRAAVASSNASTARLHQHGVTVLELNEVTELAFYVDGADESTPQLELIKGGGAALTREKIVASVAREFICIADESKWVTRLGTFPLPVEVLPMAREFVKRALIQLGGRPELREGVITDNGGEILDVHELMISNPAEMEAKLNNIPGVITNGLFSLRGADVLLLARADGVATITAPKH